MDNTIQQARDVLAKWRDEVQSPLPWRMRLGNDGREVVDADGEDIVSLWSREEASSAHLYDGDDRLIVGTAGNPALWDAIDEMLADVSANSLYPSRHAERIAAAIIAADERMNA